MDIRNSLILHVLVILFVVMQHVFSQDYDEEKEVKTSWSRCSYSWSNFKNGRAKVRARGRLTKFVCNSGFELVGKRFATCVRGQWNHPSPVCIARGCYRLPVPANSRVKESYRGAYLVYECLPGYSLKGPTFLYCDGLSWNDVTPTCEASIENPEISCDFEDPDLCGWVNDVADDFDWLRHNLETPSGHVGTGPSHDHTFGAGKAGFYMYEEASAPRKEHDVARLFSPVFPRQSGPSCFVFWYHMYGAGMGTVRIYVKSESYIFGELNPSWEKTGDQGNQWFLGKVTVPAFHERFQIIFEGLRGATYLSDMAIDDINLLQTDCDLVDSTDLVVAKASLDSCRGRCWERDNSEVCGCSEYCLSNNSCCSDYYKICNTGNDLNNTTDLEGSSEENPNGDQLVTTPEVQEVEAITTSQATLASTSSISIQTSKIPTIPPFTSSFVTEVTRNSFRATEKPLSKITLPFTSETSSRTTAAIPRITSEDFFSSSSVKPTKTSISPVRTTTTTTKITTASTTTVSTLSTMKITPKITTTLRTTSTPKIITTPKTTTSRTATTQRSTTTPRTITTTQRATTAWRTTAPPQITITTPRTTTATTTATPRTTTTTTTQTTTTRVVTSPVSIIHSTTSTFKTPLTTFQSALTPSVNTATTEKESQISVETKLITSTKSYAVFFSPIPQISEIYNSTSKNPQTVATVPAWVKPDTLSISSSTKYSTTTTKNSMDITSKNPTFTSTLPPMLRTASTNTNQISTTALSSFTFNITTLLPPVTAKTTVTPRYNLRPRSTTKLYSPSTSLIALRTTKLPTRAISITPSTTSVTRKYNFRPRYTSMRAWPSFTRTTTAKPIWTTKSRNRWTFIDIATKKWSTKSVTETTLQKSMTEKPFSTTVRIIESNQEQLAHKMKTNSGLYATGIIVSVLLVVALAGGTVYFLLRNKKKQIQRHLSEDSEIRFLSDNEVIEFSDPSALHRLRYE